MKNIIIYLIIAIVFAGTGYFIWRDMGKSDIKEGIEDKTVVDIIKDKATTTATQSSDKAPVVSLNIPDFKKIAVDAGITGAAREALIADIQVVIKTLEGNVMNPAAWTQLGILRQQAKDYSGAIVAWQFASQISAQNAVPLLNIADTYGYYLHDNAKAEEYFKKAIIAEPKNGYIYFKTYEFFTDIKDSVKARAILEQGVAVIPTDTQLKAVLDSLK